MNIFERILKKADRVLKFHYRNWKAKKLGLVYIKPNYIYFDVFDNSSEIIDVGCGDDADFSIHMIDKYSLQSFAIDPTRKHANSLQSLEKHTQGKLKHLSLAVASTDGAITFHESMENMSGSIFDDHKNIIADSIKSYEVESITLGSLLARIGITTADYLKLDLEGAEYELLFNAAESDLRLFKQIFVEFHHHCLERYSINDTKSVVRLMQQKGFNAVTVDNNNYLFFRKTEL